MVAVYGKNFCTSAREAFFLLMRNVVRVAVLDRVTDFLLFLGKVLIAGGVGVIAFFFFTKKIPVMQEKVPDLNCYWVPLLTVVIGAYLIAHGFFSVYVMCVDTLFLCFSASLVSLYQSVRDSWSWKEITWPNQSCVKDPTPNKHDTENDNTGLFGIWIF